MNGFQVEVDPDGVRRYVVAHRDPGVANWIDTTGLPEGFLSLRWTYSERPAALPTTRVVKLRFDEIRAQLPAGTRSVSRRGTPRAHPRPPGPRAAALPALLTDQPPPRLVATYSA